MSLVIVMPTSSAAAATGLSARSGTSAVVKAPVAPRNACANTDRAIPTEARSQRPHGPVPPEQGLRQSWHQLAQPARLRPPWRPRRPPAAGEARVLAGHCRSLVSPELLAWTS